MRCKMVMLLLYRPLKLDGGQHTEQVKYDNRRTAWLESQGYTVIRFWNNDVLENIEGVLEVVSGLIQSPQPVLPPQQGEGT